MLHLIVHWLFTYFRIGRCPTCGAWTSFSAPIAVAYGVPADMIHLVPQVVKCHTNGCTSSVRAIVSLEERKS